MYDIAIIGAGPGGYQAALKAAQSKQKVCLIEKDLIGGTCLNKGCIPTKAILQSTKVLREINNSKEYGIDISGYNPNITDIIRRKDAIVSKLRSGAEALLKSKGIDIIKGEARIIDNKTIEAGGRKIDSKYIIIATGSSPVELSNVQLDHRHILSSEDILNLAEIPEKIIIIGGGYIGCEFASIYNQLGSKVTIVEIMEQILPSEDKEIARRLETIFKKEGIEIIKGKKISSVNISKGIELLLENGQRLGTSVVLLCVGRRPNTDGLNLEAIGIKTEKGRVIVDKRLKTNIENIYAIGDVIGGYNLAHVATYEANVAVDNILGKENTADYSCLPCAVFTYPEIASVGLNEDKAKAQGIKYSVSKIPFAAISKAHIEKETEGFIKIIYEPGTKKIHGAQIIGPSASELVAELTIAMQNGLTADELSKVIYAHPTLSEVVLEASQKA